MAHIFQITFWIAFYFDSNFTAFYSNLGPVTSKSAIGSETCLAEQATYDWSTNVDHVLWHHITSLGHKICQDFT